MRNLVNIENKAVKPTEKQRPESPLEAAQRRYKDAAVKVAECEAAYISALDAASTARQALYNSQCEMDQVTDHLQDLRSAKGRS